MRIGHKICYIQVTVTSNQIGGGIIPEKTMAITANIKDKKTNVLNAKQKALFVRYYPLVNKVVNSMRAKLPSHADIDELHSAGVSGLADAIQRLDPDREQSFGGYVSTRIRGAIIDELRDLDYMSRSARSDAKTSKRKRVSNSNSVGGALLTKELRAEMAYRTNNSAKFCAARSMLVISLNDTRAIRLNSVPSFSINRDEKGRRRRRSRERK